MKLICLVLILFSSLSYAQNSTLEGKVVDVFDNNLETVYIYNRNVNEHTHTLVNGSFKLLQSNVGDTLDIRLLGYKAKTLKLTEVHFSEGITIMLEDKIFQLEELVIKQQQNPIEQITKMDIKLNPVNSSQEILRKVPGLFIGQHAGGGKAEQIFLRGFDIDHGTDIAIDVDGIAVNMVSHAHGQGYSDLHFLIPETIDIIRFDKGSYTAEKGNFATAGTISFTTKEAFHENSIKFEIGDFNTFRTVGLFDLLKNEPKKNAIVAVEYQESDGPFESPQNFNRVNLFGKYTAQLSDTKKISFSASHFTSQWTASGQIPQRAVDQGLISRFGAIDDTEGGQTSRTNFLASFDQFLADNTTIQTKLFYTLYDFELYSNFTFFLNDPVNGDQIKQKEGRSLLGMDSRMTSNFSSEALDIDITAGFSLRNDNVKDSELSRTKNRREILSRVSYGNINETNVSGFIETEFDFGKIRLIPSARLDYFKFLYEDFLVENYEQQSDQAFVFSPKFTTSLNINDQLNVFFKSGIGFHSNDTRVILNNDAEEALPRSYTADLGFNLKPISKLFLNTSIWYIGLDQEFVYVGDEGIVEPSGKTRRYGVDATLRYQMMPWLYFHTDFTYTKARAVDESSGNDFIPLAPIYTWTSGLTLKEFRNFSGTINLRYLGDRPANEDYSIVAEGYTVVDFNISYEWKNVDLNLAIENLFDVEWNETQFATESRLANESNSVEEIHFTPGTPFYIKAGLVYKF